MLNSNFPEDKFELPLADQARLVINEVKSDIPELSPEEFKVKMTGVFQRPIFDFEYFREPLFNDNLDRAHIFTNADLTGPAADVISFHFPGSSGQWDEERCGPQFDGYAGAALRGGVGKAVIADWSYANPGINAGQSRHVNIGNQVKDIVEIVKESEAKRVYLSGRSYGAMVVLFSVPEVKKLGIEIVGIDLKVPAISSTHYNSQIAEALGETPVFILRGDKDPNTNFVACNDLYTKVRGQKAMVTLKDVFGKHPDYFNHHLNTPEIKFASAAATEVFIKSTVK